MTDYHNCAVAPTFGRHGGQQMRRRHYFACGCDAGSCEFHGVNRPFGPKWEPGEPTKCAKHSKEAP